MQIENFSKDTFCLTFVEDPIYFSLMRSIKHMFDTFTCTQIKNKLFIKAKNIRFYKDFIDEEYLKNGSMRLSHAWCLRIVYCLSKQIEYLIANESKCFYKLDFDHLLVIEDVFFYLSPESLSQVVQGMLQIPHSPLEKKDGFFSPELLDFIGSCSGFGSIHYKTIYYSLGLLLMSALNMNNGDSLEKIKDTKLYYFIIRCLQKDIHHRHLIFL